LQFDANFVEHPIARTRTSLTQQ